MHYVKSIVTAALLLPAAPGWAQDAPRTGFFSISESLAEVVGADIVELNPSRDMNAMTAMVAVKFLKEIADKMIKLSRSNKHIFGELDAYIGKSENIIC